MGYEAIPMTLTPERADITSYMLQQLINFDSLFNDYTPGCEDRCGLCQRCMQRKLIISHNLISPRAAVWEVWRDDNFCGILWLSDVVPGHDARGEFTFWDRRLQGKRQLLENWIQDVVFGTLNLHRLTVEIPDYMHALGRYLERYLGFEMEGRKKEAMKREGRWRDVLIFGRLSECQVEQLQPK